MTPIGSIAGVILGLAVFGSVALLPSGAAAWCPAGSYWDHLEDHCVQYSSKDSASCAGECKVCYEPGPSGCLRCSLNKDCLAATTNAPVTKSQGQAAAMTGAQQNYTPNNIPNLRKHPKLIRVKPSGGN